MANQDMTAVIKDAEAFLQNLKSSERSGIRLGTVEALLKRRIANALNRTFNEKRKIEQPDITMSYLVQLFYKQDGRCALTGRVLSFMNVFNKGNKDDKDLLSIDRIDSTRGYIKGNVRFVTYHANIAKSKYSDEDFIALCRDVVKQHTFP